MKKLLIAISVVGLAFFAKADYLLWQVNGDGAEDFDFNAVRIGYSTDGSTTAAGYLQLAYVNDSGDYTTFGEVTGVITGTKTTPTGYYADFNGLTGSQYSFFIELINYDASTSPTTIDMVAVSQTASYLTLVDRGYVDTSLTPTVPTTVWHGGSYTAVPEPTSAMLVMMGLGLLALKRKKA